MNPRQLAKAIAERIKVKDTVSGKVFVPVTVDFLGNVAGFAEDGKMVKAKAENLVIANEQTKTDAEQQGPVQQ